MALLALWEIGRTLDSHLQLPSVKPTAFVNCDIPSSKSINGIDIGEQQKPTGRLCVVRFFASFDRLVNPFNLRLTILPIVIRPEPLQVYDRLMKEMTARRC